MADLASKLGICQWFHYEDYQTVARAVGLLRDLGVRHLRTGLSWADFYRPRGKQWYDWQMQQLADFDVLLSVWHTPPSISEGNSCASPPRRLQDYADFVDLVITEYGERFTHLELWNEPNNVYKWDFRNYDPDWSKFGGMIVPAGYWARRRGVPVVLGGMSPIDASWLELVKRYGVLENLDVVAVHGFPEMWWPDHPNWCWYDHWQGWEEMVGRIAAKSDGKPVWITETGLATWDITSEREGRFDLQVQMLEQAAAAPVERVYWYSLIDLDPAREAIEGFHVDENEYHMGLVRWDGTRKEACHRLREWLRDGRI